MQKDLKVLAGVLLLCPEWWALLLLLSVVLLITIVYSDPVATDWVVINACLVVVVPFLLVAMMSILPSVQGIQLSVGCVVSMVVRFGHSVAVALLLVV